VKLTRYKADGLLLLAAAIWGSGFVAQRAGMDHVGPFTFTGARFGIGALVLLPIIHARARRASTNTSPPRATFRPLVPQAALAGVVLFVGAALQQIGLVDTTAGKGGFITGLYVVFVPLIGVLIRHRIPPVTWPAAALAAVGLYLLSVTGAFEINPGDLFVLACAVVWAVHVLIIGWLSPRTDPLKLAAFQFAIASMLGTLAALALEEITLADLHAARWAILYSGVFSVGTAFTLQVVSQQHAPPTHAAILLSLEAVFAALFGSLLLDETFTHRQYLGGALMLAAMLVSQIRKSPQPTIHA
jgi:drug/metabolite transporter (DMT)-like permease